MFLISSLLNEQSMLPLKRVMIYTNFGLYTENRKLWDMYLTGNDNQIIRFSFVTKHDIKEHKLVDQLLKYFGKPDEKDKS